MRNRTLIAASDAELMTLVSGGCPEAFASLYDRYCDRAHRVAWFVCGTSGCAEDAVQEAFLSVWNARASYHEARGTVASWLLTVVRRRAIDVLRREGGHSSKRQSDECLEALPGLDDVPEAAVRRESTQHLKSAVSLLPPTQQAVIALAFYGQLTHTEIASQLDIPPGTVKGRMRLGLRKLSCDAGLVETLSGHHSRAGARAQPPL